MSAPENRGKALNRVKKALKCQKRVRNLGSYA